MKEFFKNLRYDKFIDLFSDKNILKYLIILYAVTILPVLIFVLIYYNNSAQIIENEVTQAMLKTVKQAKVNLDERMKSVKGIADMAFGNEIILDGMASRPQDMSPFQERTEMLNISKEIARYQEGSIVYKMRLYVEDKKTYANDQIYFMPFENFKAHAWYPQVQQKNGGIQWLPTHYEDYIDVDDEQVVSCVRLMKDKNNISKVIGGLKIDLSANDIFDVINSVDLSENERIYIVDNAGSIIYPLKDSVNGDNLSSMYHTDIGFLTENLEGTRKIDKHGNGEYMIYTTLQQAGWKIVAYMPMEGVMAKSSVLNMATTFILLIFIILLIMFITTMMFGILNKKIGERMEKIAMGMEQNGMESYTEAVNFKGISTLEKNVDRMIGTVRRLVKESYDARLKEREATLKALQAQINPHFLYNTLNLINIMAMKHGARDLSYMLEALSKYFRLTLNKGRDIVNVSDELELARVYLEIQKKRFEGSIEYRFETDKEVMGYVMPKLTLQPLIENAIIHGILQKDDKKGIIILKAYVLEEQIVFEVEDNGVGIPAEKLKGLTSNSDENQKSDSYALNNINERLQVFYGNDCNLTITSEVGKGTFVKVSIKALRNGLE